MDLAAPFRRKRRQPVYFAILLSDRPAEGFKFTPDRECKMHMVTGEATPGVIIPGTVLKAMMEQYLKPEGEISVTEKTP